MALVLEEIQVAHQPLDLRVKHKVLARDPGVGEAAARDKVHGNGELSFGRSRPDPSLSIQGTSRGSQRRAAPAPDPLNHPLGTQKEADLRASTKE